VIHEIDVLKLADEVAAALQDMGDFWAYGMAKSEDAEPAIEDHRTVAELSKRARSALDAYKEARRAIVDLWCPGELFATELDPDGSPKAGGWLVEWPNGEGDLGCIPNRGPEWWQLALARARQGAKITALYPIPFCRTDKYRCTKCGCFWRLNPSIIGSPTGSWSLYDAHQKPCKRCDNDPAFLSIIEPVAQ